MVTCISLLSNKCSISQFIDWITKQKHFLIADTHKPAYGQVVSFNKGRSRNSGLVISFLLSSLHYIFFESFLFVFVLWSIFRCGAFCLLRHRFCREKVIIFKRLNWFYTLKHLVFVFNTYFPIYKLPTVFCSFICCLIAPPTQCELSISSGTFWNNYDVTKER